MDSEIEEKDRLYKKNQRDQVNTQVGKQWIDRQTYDIDR